MAVVTQPLGSSEARGSVGGLTYNTYRGKHTVKTRSGPSRDPTARQLEVLAAGALAQAEWSSITAAQRSMWDQYADEHPEISWTGSPKRLSGNNWFVRLNSRLELMQSPHIADPPPFNPPEQLITISPSASAGFINVDWSTFPAVFQQDYFVDFRSEFLTSPGRRGSIKNAVWVLYQTADYPPAQWGPVPTGFHWIFARLVHAFSGIATPWQGVVVEVA